MEQCPTCNAKYKGNRICHRCKTDLGSLLDIEYEAGIHLEKASAAFAEKKFDQMFFHAKRAYTLRQTPKAAKILACAAMLVKKYNLAMNQWKMVKNPWQQLKNKKTKKGKKK